jgi:F-type H+-transporting ATPase subunit b
MIRSLDKFRGAILTGVCGLWLFLGGATAQNAADSPSSERTAPAADSAKGQSNSPDSSALAKESQEAGNQDQQAEFKHSSSVRLVARLTGLSLDHAYWLCVLLNFAVVAGAIGWASKKHLPAMFKNRTAAIQQAMAEARKTSEEANRRLADIEARLSRLGSEIEEMRVAAENEAAAEEARTKAAAIEDARRIVQSAEQEIAAAARAARRDLTAYAADLAVSLARKQIHVDAATDEALIRGFAKQLSDSEIPETAKGSS